MLVGESVPRGARVTTAEAALLREIAAWFDVKLDAGTLERVERFLELLTLWNRRIRLTGEGHTGAPGGPAGDVYVLVRVQPDPRFVREGHDIFSTVDLTMTEAALGAHLTVPTLDGDTELEFEPGTQPGEVRVLSGRGMPVLQG